MKLSEKQKSIVDRIRLKGQITTSEANEMLEHYYYHNHAHYISEILTNMVKRGYIIRVKKGVYGIGSFASQIPGIVDKDQLSLL